MKKISLSLLAAGVMAAAGFAQADAIYYPDGTMVELGESGTDTLALGSSTASDTSVLGAGPALATVTTVSAPQVVYVQPNIHWDRTVAMTQMRSNVHLMHKGLGEHERKQAAATFNVPARAGEASTMTNGVPNAMTHNPNGSMVVGSYSIPYTVVTTEPYYIFSY
jgi:hypothetical protein